MAAYEDFQFFRGVRLPTAARSAAIDQERDVLRAELDRIHAEVRRLRARDRRRAWPRRLIRLFTRFVPPLPRALAGSD